MSEAQISSKTFNNSGVLSKNMLWGVSSNRKYFCRSYLGGNFWKLLLFVIVSSMLNTFRSFDAKVMLVLVNREFWIIPLFVVSNSRRFTFRHMQSLIASDFDFSYFWWSENLCPPLLTSANPIMLLFSFWRPASFHISIFVSHCLKRENILSEDCFSISISKFFTLLCAFSKVSSCSSQFLNAEIFLN